MRSDFSGFALVLPCVAGRGVVPSALLCQWDEDHINYNFDVRKGPIQVEYFKGGMTNICYNALDKHVKEGNGDRVCFLWEGNDLDQDKKMTYQEVLDEVCQLVSRAAA